MQGHARPSGEGGPKGKGRKGVGREEESKGARSGVRKGVELARKKDGGRGWSWRVKRGRKRGVLYPLCQRQEQGLCPFGNDL